MTIVVSFVCEIFSSLISLGWSQSSRDRKHFQKQVCGQNVFLKVDYDEGTAQALIAVRTVRLTVSLDTKFEKKQSRSFNVGVNIMTLRQDLETMVQNLQRKQNGNASTGGYGNASLLVPRRRRRRT